MKELDMLDKIAKNLSEKKSVACLSDYEVLCNNITFLFSSYTNFLAGYDKLVLDIEKVLQDDANLRTDFKSGRSKYPFRILIPSLLKLMRCLFSKFETLTLPENKSFDASNVGKLHKDFKEYNDLITAVRQMVDNVIQSSYQMSILEPKEFNYLVLSSLNSFEKYATKSIRQGLFNQDVEDILTEFRTLPPKQFKCSYITECKHETFNKKVEYILRLLNDPSNPIKDELNNIYKFSSDFTHIGYISSFFSNTACAEVIFTSSKGAYLPSTENFNELKYQVMETCLSLLYIIFLPCLKLSLQNMLEDSPQKQMIDNINILIKQLTNAIQTRNNSYFFFVQNNAIKTNKGLKLTCKCGHLNIWSKQRNSSDLYCKGCGSRFSIFELEGSPTHVPTDKGLVPVLGANLNDFE